MVAHKDVTKCLIYSKIYGGLCSLQMMKWKVLIIWTCRTKSEKQHEHKVECKAWDLDFLYKNENDGSVTMELQGTPEQLATLEERIKRGNGFAKVNQLDSSEIEVVPNETKFETRY